MAQIKLILMSNIYNRLVLNACHLFDQSDYVIIDLIQYMYISFMCET